MRGDRRNTAEPYPVTRRPTFADTAIAATSPLLIAKKPRMSFTAGPGSASLETWKHGVLAARLVLPVGLTESIRLTGLRVP